MSCNCDDEPDNGGAPRDRRPQSFIALASIRDLANEFYKCVKNFKNVIWSSIAIKNVGVLLSSCRYGAKVIKSGEFQDVLFVEKIGQI